MNEPNDQDRRRLTNILECVDGFVNEAAVLRELAEHRLGANPADDAEPVDETFWSSLLPPDDEMGFVWITESTWLEWNEVNGVVLNDRHDAILLSSIKTRDQLRRLIAVLGGE